MAYCTFAPDAGMFASTPVENLFIQEYMLRAPGDYVKVYLYGLMQSIYPSMAESSLQKFGQALKMEVEQVQKAFAYWHAKGLLREKNGQNADQGYEYIDIRHAMYEGKISLSQGRMYEYTELSNKIAAAAPEHSFTPQELELLYDLKDVDGFEEDALSILVSFGWQTYKKRLNLTRLTALSREWKEKRIITAEKANEYCMGVTLRASPANKVLAELGIAYRNVTQAEHELYEKWTKEWRFSLDAIRQACAGMTGVQNPNFKYLDKRLSSLQERGLNTATKILQGEFTQNEIDEKVQKCMFRLGLTGKVTQEQRNYYDRWRNSYNMSEEMILLSCDEASVLGTSSFRGVENLISSYVRRGFISPDQIKEDRTAMEDAKRVLNSAGIMRAPTETDKKQVQSWQKNMPLEVILQAAEYAKDSQKPIGYLHRILTNWQQKGVKTIAQAKAERAAFEKGYAKTTPKKNPAHYQNEREYEKDELAQLIDELPND